jgi:hypothetical protein
MLAAGDADSRDNAPFLEAPCLENNRHRRCDSLLPEGHSACCHGIDALFVTIIERQQRWAGRRTRPALFHFTGRCLAKVYRMGTRRTGPELSSHESLKRHPIGRVLSRLEFYA